MLDEAAIRILAHRQNIDRYRSLLATPLTELERAFIDRRIAEEEAAVRSLLAHRRAAATSPASRSAAPADDCIISR